MSSASGNARAYAESLLSVADGKGTTNEVDKALVSLGSHLLDEPSVLAFFRSAALGPAEKRKVVEAAFNPDKGVPVHLYNLLRILADRRDLRLLPVIALEWQRLLDDRIGRVRFRVTTARQLDDGERTKIVDAVGSVLGPDKEAVAEEKVDESLLGGIVLQIQDTRIDGSVRSRMRRMRALLMESSAS